MDVSRCWRLLNGLLIVDYSSLWGEALHGRQVKINTTSAFSSVQWNVINRRRRLPEGAQPWECTQRGEEKGKNCFSIFFLLPPKIPSFMSRDRQWRCPSSAGSDPAAETSMTATWTFFPPSLVDFFDSWFFLKGEFSHGAMRSSINTVGTLCVADARGEQVGGISGIVCQSQRGNDDGRTAGRQLAEFNSETHLHPAQTVRKLKNSVRDCRFWRVCAQFEFLIHQETVNVCSRHDKFTVILLKLTWFNDANVEFLSAFQWKNSWFFD